MQSENSNPLNEDYDSDLLRVEVNKDGNFHLKSKGVRLGALSFVVSIGSFMVFIFGIIAFFGGQDVITNKVSGWKGGVIGLFGAGVAIFVLAVIREALWECLPKNFTINPRANFCYVRSYLFLRWKIPLNQVRAIGLKVGKLPGTNKGRDGFYTRLYLFKNYGVHQLRICAPTIRDGSRHSAFQEGVKVGKMVSMALKVPLLYKKKGWVEL